MLSSVIAGDLDLFVSTEEFAEEITLDGEELRAQVLRNTAAKSQRVTQTWYGLHGDFVTVYFKASDYSKEIPHHGQWVFINGKRYDVLDSSVALGIARLTCAAYRQNNPRSLSI